MKTRVLIFCSPLLIAPPLKAAPLYWDGPNGDWGVGPNWSVDAAGTDNIDAAPGAGDVAHFNITSANSTASVINLNGTQAVSGLVFSSTGNPVSIRGGSSNSVLELGAGGIVANSGTTVLNIGEGGGNPTVTVALTANQSWLYNGSNTANMGIMVRNNVEVKGASTFTLSLGGNQGSSSISTISGVISDGTDGGKLNLTMIGNGGVSNTNRWNLSGNNTYTGVTTISSGGLGINHVNALGATGASSGTIVASGASLFIRAGLGIIAPESLTISGGGVGTLGALRNVSGSSTWTGPIQANASSNVYIGSDVGGIFTLSNTADITTTGSSSLVFTANGSGTSTINVDGAITGTAGLIKGGSVATSFVNLGGDAKTYGGATAINIGTLSVNTQLTNTSGVAVGPASGTNTGTLRGNNGSINTLATTTINPTGTLAPGETGSMIGTLSMGALNVTSLGTIAIDVNSTSGLHDVLNITNLTLAANATLTVADLGAGSLSIGTALLFIKNSDTWQASDGFFTVGGNVIHDESETFQVGSNIFHINYDYSGVEGTGVALIVVPEPTSASLVLLGAATILRRRRRG